MALRCRGNATLPTYFLDPTSGDEVCVDVEARVTSGSSDYFDRGAGCWYPGDAGEVELLSAVGENGVDYLPAIESDASWLNKVEEAAMEAAEDLAAAAAEDAAECRAEMRAEARA